VIIAVIALLVLGVASLTGLLLSRSHTQNVRKRFYVGPEAVRTLSVWRGNS